MIALVVLLFLSLSESPLLAAPEGAVERHQSFVSTIAPYINFAILVGILVYFLKKPLGEFLAQKRDAIGKMLKDSEQERDVAMARLKELQARLQSLESDIDLIKKNAEREALAERERLLEEARDEARRILEAAEKEVSNRFKLAVRDLKLFAAGEAVAKAEGIIKEKLDPENHEKLIDTYLDNLSKN